MSDDDEDQEAGHVHEHIVREAFEQVWVHGDFGLIGDRYVDHNSAPGLPGTERVCSACGK